MFSNLRHVYVNIITTPRNASGSGSFKSVKLLNCRWLWIPSNLQILLVVLFYCQIKNIISHKSFILYNERIQIQFRFYDEISHIHCVELPLMPSAFNLTGWVTDRRIDISLYEIASASLIMSNGILSATTVDIAKTSFLCLLSVSLSVLWWILFQL